MAAKKPQRRSSRRQDSTTALAKRTRDALEKMLHRHVRLRSRHGPHHFTSTVPETHRNIVGVGMTRAHPAHGTLDAHAAAPGEQALTVYVAEPRAIADIKAALKDALGKSYHSIDDLPLHVVVTGVIRAQSQTSRVRPVPGGVSSGHFRGSIANGGSTGCLVTGLHAPRSAQRLVLSNNHVYGDVNTAHAGDCLSQPCGIDGGHCPADQFATVERIVPLQWFQPNVVDAALGLAQSPAAVRPEILYVKDGLPTYVPISATPAVATPGMVVAKSGRTTQLTTGQIVDTAATIHVTYGSQSAFFQDQLTVQGNADTPFSGEGDSGSLVWTYDHVRSPVGLLFSAGTLISFANKIQNVLSALDVRILV